MKYLWIITLFIITVSIASSIPVYTQTYRLKAFVSTDAPIYLPGQNLTVEVFIYPLVSMEKTATIKLYFTDLPNAPTIPEIHLTIPSINDKKFLQVSSQPVAMPDVNDGTYHLKMEIWVEGSKIVEDTVDFWIRHGPPSGVEPIILFVWHNHQAPNYYPDGEFFSRWHIDHFFNDHLQPYFSLDQVYNESIYSDMGTYYLHYYLLTKYPHVKANLHFSPSLIYQLYLNATHGFYIFDVKTSTFRKVNPGSPLANVIWDFFKGLKKLQEEGRVYVMTSVFAHTIMGYYIDRYDVDKLLRYDMELGINWTRKTITDTDAFWTPEMAWSDKLIPLYIGDGIKYTVLDGTHHFPGSSGDKGTIFEPYIVKDSEGRELIVFFRDQVVSDRDIGFTNQDWDDPRNADRDARQLYYNIYNIHSFKNYQYPPIEVIAADGENWMLFAPSTANGALFLDRLYRYMDKLTVEGVMRSGTFKDAVQAHPPQRVLNSIPSTSWLGGWGKWTTERGEEHRTAWSKMDEAMAKYKAYLYYRGINTYDSFIETVNSVQYFNNSVIDLIHAMDSDFWWAEFFSMTYIDRWLEAFNNEMKYLFNIKVVTRTEPENLVAGKLNKLYITLYNNNNYVLRNIVIKAVIKNVNSTQKRFNIEPGSSKEIVLLFKPSKGGKYRLSIRIYNPNTVINGEIYYLYSKEYWLNIYNPVDLMVKVVVHGPGGVLAGIKPAPPGEYTFTVGIATSDNKPVEYEVPVKIILTIKGENITKETSIPVGEDSVVEIIRYELPVGQYRYTVTVESPYDIELDNNVFYGQVIVTSQSTESVQGGGEGPGLTDILLYTAIGVWIIVIILVLFRIIKKK